MLKYFGIPFANAGGKTAVPAADPGTGAVSYATGWGPYYQLAKTDPNSLNVDRQQTNQTLFDITSEIKLLQEHGVPDFITSALNGGAAYSYGIGDIVRYLGAVYVSRVAANVDLPSVAASWSLVRFAGIPKAVAGGTADVVTANFSPDLGTLLDGDQVLIQHVAVNTGAVTINPDGAGALGTYKGANQPLVAGDISGADFWGLYTYDASLNKLQMLNPALGIAALGVRSPGTIFAFGGTSAPAGSLLCPTAATTVSRTTYAALFAAIGTTWGVGDGATTFGIPFFPANYAMVQANADVGTQTVGEVIAHTHSSAATSGAGSARPVGGGVVEAATSGSATGSTGGAANLAAGSRVLMCVQF